MYSCRDRVSECGHCTLPMSLKSLDNFLKATSYKALQMAGYKDKGYRALLLNSIQIVNHNTWVSVSPLDSYCHVNTQRVKVKTKGGPGAELVSSDFGERYWCPCPITADPTVLSDGLPFRIQSVSYSKTQAKIKRRKSKLREKCSLGL